jgi:UDP-glucose 4-epimerase
MRVVVTGGAGFIGSHVAEQLVVEGHNVLVIDDLSGGFEENIPKGAQFERRSVNAELDSLFNTWRPEVIYHLAAYAAEGLSHHIPLFNYGNNLQGTVNLLSAAYRCGVRHLVFTSSIAVYGHSVHHQTPFTEETPCAPCDPYGVAKLACEYHISAFQQYYGRPNYTIFRPHNVFGPRQNIADPYRNVVGIFMLKAMRNEPLPIFGDGSQSRSFSYISAVARCIALAPFIDAAVNRTFNIGGDESLTVLDLAKAICEVMNISHNFSLLPARKEVLQAHSAHEKARRVFSSAFRDETGIREGLALTYEYVLRHAIPAATECPSGIEISDLLPPSWRDRLVTPSPPGIRNSDAYLPERANEPAARS